MSRTIVVAGVVGLVLFLLLVVVTQWWHTEGMEDAQMYSTILQHMFMTPGTKKDSVNTVMLTKPTFNLNTRKTEPKTYYVPPGWYIVMVTEYVDDSLQGEVPRMTKLSDKCTLDATTGDVLPKNKTDNCMSSFNITTFNNAEAISKMWNTNTMSSIEQYFKANVASVDKILGNKRSVESELSDTTKALAEVEKGMKDEDYQTAFEKSQKALLDAKKKYSEEHMPGEDAGRGEKPKFDVSNVLLQYDAAMPVFWDKALLSGSDNLFPLFREPGSFRDYGKTYVPSYEDSIFLSQSTKLPEYAAVTNRPDQMGGFCHQTLGADALEQKCNSLKSDVCASTECCVLLGGSKCVAGDVQGPSTPSNYSDFTIQNRDFYYFKGKCYGNCYQNGASSMYKNTADKFPSVDATTASNDASAIANINKSLTAGALLKAAPAPAAKKYSVGDEIEAMLYNSDGEYTQEHGYEQWFTAKIIGPTKVNLDTVEKWQIQWVDGPLSGDKGSIYRDGHAYIWPEKPRAPAAGKAPKK